MRICIVYHQRLGDIIRILPIARHLAGQGHSVYVECFAQYWGLFSCVSYVRPSDPKQRDKMRFGRVLELEIWPHRYDEYRASGKPWGDFVFGLFPEFAQLNQRPEFDLIDEQPPLQDYGFSREICLLAPFGYSQGKQHHAGALMEACRRVAKRPIVFLADEAQEAKLLTWRVPQSMILRAKSPAHLPRIIRDAEEMFTINSSPCIIAGAVRKEFWHVSSGVAQDDAFSPASRVVTVGD